MRVTDLTNNYGVPLFRGEEELWNREVKVGDEILFETLRNGTKRYIRVTGNTPTSWRMVEVKPQENNDSLIF